MSDIKHKTRFELIRNNSLINVFEPKMEPGNDDLEISTSSSIDSFPTLTFRSLNPELNNFFMGYSKNDIVRLSVAHDGEDIYMTIFEGEFSGKEMKYASETNCLALNIESIHSFFRLSLLEISSKQEFKNVTFENFVKELMEISDINIEINISSDVAIIPITGISRHTNLFRLFKEVCLHIPDDVEHPFR
jgi:hypothetical protein